MYAPTIASKSKRATVNKITAPTQITTTTVWATKATTQCNSYFIAFTNTQHFGCVCVCAFFVSSNFFHLILLFVIRIYYFLFSCCFFIPFAINAVAPITACFSLSLCLDACTFLLLLWLAAVQHAFTSISSVRVARCTPPFNTPQQQEDVKKSQHSNVQQQRWNLPQKLAKELATAPCTNCIFFMYICMCAYECNKKCCMRLCVASINKYMHIPTSRNICV